MPAGELFIRYNSDWTGISGSSRYAYDSQTGAYTQNNNGSWVDMFKQWGVSMDSTGLSNLMIPAPLKAMIENEVATENGRRVIRTQRPVDERTLTLGINISAPTKEAFLARYSAFCSQVLYKGKLDLSTRYQQGVFYHLDYLSCQSFGEYSQSLGKFMLRVVEPNPANRV